MKVIKTEECIDRSWTYYDDPRNGGEMTMLAQSVIRTTPSLQGAKKKIVAMKWFLNFHHDDPVIKKNCVAASKAIVDQLKEDGVGIQHLQFSDFDVRKAYNLGEET